jgi:hypothetical protein
MASREVDLVTDAFTQGGERVGGVRVGAYPSATEGSLGLSVPNDKRPM